MKLSYIDPYGVSGTFVEQLARIERIGMNAVRLTFTTSRADWSEATEATVVARIVLTAEQFERMRRMVGHPDQRADKVFNMSTGGREAAAGSC